MHKREWSTGREHHFKRTSPLAWIVSHAMKYPILPFAAIAAAIINNFSYSGIQAVIGWGFGIIVDPGFQVSALLSVAAVLCLLAVGQGVFGLIRNYAIEFLAQRIERDARDELYASLLGKSQTFHGRQRLGDLMARCTNDVRMLNTMFSPGLMLIIDSVMAIVAPFVLIAILNYRLLVVPVIFLAFLGLTVWDYSRRLAPVSMAEREQFGAMNATLEEGISGIQIIKSNAQEKTEWEKFRAQAAKYRDLYIRQGIIQGKYFPMLVFAICNAAAFLYGLWLWNEKTITIAEFVAFMGLMNAFRFPTFISLYSFVLVQLGMSSASRILAVVNEETELDENTAGVSRTIRGSVEFRGVSFMYDGKTALSDVSFAVQPGQTVAVVGKTGSGKTTMLRLLNRIYDASGGGILIDGVDVREWSMESLRQQIGTIEQDVFLFSKSIAENISFCCPGSGHEKITEVASLACAHDFIMEFDKGYDTVIGERGVTLSGGQRQRIAIARAFLKDPRIMVMDDSTSAIDSRTEDEIQRAMKRISRNRTTFIITHRLSQIRWADKILVMDKGRLVASGGHEELMRKSPEYRRIFDRN